MSLIDAARAAAVRADDGVARREAERLARIRQKRLQWARELRDEVARRFEVEPVERITLDWSGPGAVAVEVDGLRFVWAATPAPVLVRFVCPDCGDDIQRPSFPILDLADLGQQLMEIHPACARKAVRV